jgi:DNA-binding transcriptional LysR family regulator
MDTRLLRSFVMVAEELHFGRAAERLHIAQPWVSSQIKRLEVELGVQLFVRDRRKVVLTEAGRAFLKEARLILERVDLARQVVRQAGRGEIGSLVFGYEETTLYSIFPSIVRLYKERFPGVALDLRDMPTAEQTEALLRGEIDVGLVQELATSEDLRVETVLYEPLIAALPDNHPLADEPQVALEDLAEDPFVLFPRWTRPGCYDLITGLCREAGYVPNIVQETESKQGLVGLVAAGIGVTLTNAHVRHLQRPGLVYKDIAQADAQVNTALAWRPEYETPLLRGFLGVAREAS